VAAVVAGGGRVRQAARQVAAVRGEFLEQRGLIVSRSQPASASISPVLRKLAPMTTVS
jgi:hypothetical protein